MNKKELVVIIRCPKCNGLLKQKPRSKFYCRKCQKYISHNNLNVKFIYPRQTKIDDYMKNQIIKMEMS